MTDKRKEPEIRFAGFTDVWEQRKLRELSSLITKGTTPLDKSGNGNINFVKIESIDSLSGKITITSTISEEEHNGYLKRSQLQEGDVLFSIAGTLGRVTTLNKDMLPANTNQALAIIRLKNSCIDYITTYLKGKAVSEFVKKNPTVGAQPNLSLEQVGNMEIALPNSDEQEEIGQYFKSLDYLISLHQHKVDKLVIIKKSMLQKMFPNNDSNLPEIRFAEFTDTWEQRKLLESVDKIIDFRGRTPKKLGMDWSETGYLALSALNVKNGYIEAEADAHYGDQVLYDIWMSGNQLHQGQVLFTTEAPMGNVAQVPDNKGYILSQRTIAFEVKRELITENYLAVVLGSPRSFSALTALCSGGTAKGVSQKSLSGFYISVPRELREQEKIANLFASLDNIITLHQRKLGKLKNIKRSMLDKMFVSEV